MGASTLQKVSIGYPCLNFTQASLWIARDAGFFAKNGLDAQLIFLRGGTRLSQALLAGNITLRVSAGPSVVVARAAGADEVIVAGGIASIADALGKGLVAGLAGTAAMTLSSTVEMKLQ